MKIITVEDFIELKGRFDKYCKDQKEEFEILLHIAKLLSDAVNKVQSDGEVKDQAYARFVFRIALGFMGEDFTQYEELSEYGLTGI